MYLPGDVVTRRKGLVRHCGIVLEDGDVLHTTPLRGVHRSSPVEFAHGKRVREEFIAPRRRREILRNVDLEQERRYNPFTNNCEHTVTRATKGKAVSPQMKGIVIGVAVGAVAFLLTRHPAVAVAGFALGKKLVDRESLY